MTDYRIETKIRNDRILRALEGIGETVGSFCKRHGWPPATLYKIAAMKIAPKHRDGMWRREIMVLCDECKLMPSDLFTERQLTPVRETKAVAQVGEDQLRAQLADLNRLAMDGINPETLMIQRDLADSLLSELSPRYREAVELSMGGESYEAIAAALGVSRGRAHQIILKAERVMREAARKKHKIEAGDRQHMAEIFGE